MDLSDRLKAVADMVSHGHNVADVGCDHAYISIYLIKNKISNKIIAMDVNEGPLKIARENIYKEGFDGKIETRLSDGLEKLSALDRLEKLTTSDELEKLSVSGELEKSPVSGELEKLQADEVDTIVIAGMGGDLTCKILQEGADKLYSVKELVLQPQSELHKVRKLLERLDFVIVKEKMLIDDGKYYVVIKAVNKSMGDVKDIGNVRNIGDMRSIRNVGNVRNIGAMRSIRNVGNMRNIGDMRIVNNNTDLKSKHIENFQRETSLQEKSTDQEFSDKQESEDSRILKETQYIYGKYLLDKQDSVLHQYLLNRKQAINNIKYKLEQAQTINANKRLREVNRQLEYINVAMNYYS